MVKTAIYERDAGWELPDPFLGENGVRIKKKEEWEERRNYYKKLLEEHFYGKMPPGPPQIKWESHVRKTIEDGKGIYEKVRLQTGPNGKIGFFIHVFRPDCMDKSVPVIMPSGDKVDENFIRMAIRQKFSIISLEIDEAAPDDKEGYKNGSCARAYPEYSWRALAMWAWLESRVMDWLEKQDFADSKKMVVTGHSRMGKAALCCGIYDERAAVVAPVGSGCGGMASLRLNGNRLGEGIGRAERIGVMLSEKNFSYWLLDEMRSYGTEDGLTPYRENEIPFDANILGSCIAPRGLVLAEGLDDTWINPFGTQVSWLAASEVYAFLGEPEKCAIHYREGGHAYTLEDWSVVLDFCNVVLNGKEKTGNYKIRGKEDVACGYSWKRPCAED